MNVNGFWFSIAKVISPKGLIREHVGESLEANVVGNWFGDRSAVGSKAQTALWWREVKVQRIYNDVVSFNLLVECCLNDLRFVRALS